MIDKIQKGEYQRTQEDRDRLLVDCANKINEIVDEINKLHELALPLEK